MAITIVNMVKKTNPLYTGLRRQFLIPHVFCLGQESHPLICERVVFPLNGSHFSDCHISIKELLYRLPII